MLQAAAVCLPLAAGCAAEPAAGAPGDGGAFGAGGAQGGTGGAAGAALPGSGGAGGAGGAVVSGGGGASLVSPPGFFAGGYLTSGPWMGWVFTFADSLGKGTTVSPTCTSSGCTPGWGLQPCISGSVAADFGAYVGLAFHVNNPQSGGTGTWASGGTGFLVSVARAPEGARLQLQEINATSNDQRYCAPVPPGGTGVIPLSSLKTYCWGDAAHASRPLGMNVPIHEAAIIVPGRSVATAFDFCLVNLLPQ